jgi:hypothetical protein
MKKEGSKGDPFTDDPVQPGEKSVDNPFDKR